MKRPYLMLYERAWPGPGGEREAYLLVYAESVDDAERKTDEWLEEKDIEPMSIISATIE